MKIFSIILRNGLAFSPAWSIIQVGNGFPPGRQGVGLLFFNNEVIKMAKVAKKSTGETSVTFGFVNGKKLVCDISELSDDIIKRLAVHGLSQKVGDSYAGAESVDQAVANATETWNNLVSDLWAVGRQTGGKLAQALATIAGVTLEEAIKTLAEMDDEKKKELRKHPKIKAEIAKMDLAAAQAQDTGKEDDLSELF